MAELLKNIIKQFSEYGEDIIETIKHRARLSTIFDIFTEKVIPSFVNERDLKEYYENKMEQVNELIYKL